MTNHLLAQVTIIKINTPLSDHYLLSITLSPDFRHGVEPSPSSNWCSRGGRRWQVYGVHLSGEVHWALGGHKPQRGRSTGGHSESDTTEERAGERGEQGGERRYGGWRALVQIQGRGACQHESEANVDLAVRQGGQQVQELREPSRALNQEGRSLGCTWGWIVGVRNDVMWFTRTAH